MNPSTAVEAPERMVDALALPHHPSAVGQARRVVRTALDDWSVAADARYAVLLVMSELVTNAIEHARGPLTLSLRRDGDTSIRVEVTDGGPLTRKRARTASGVMDEHGRGMAIIEALTTDHGCRNQLGGTMHWARLQLDL